MVSWSGVILTYFDVLEATDLVLRVFQINSKFRFCWVLDSICWETMSLFYMVEAGHLWLLAWPCWLRWYSGQSGRSGILKSGLEGTLPREYCFNPNQRHLSKLIQVQIQSYLTITGRWLWSGFELSSAGHWPPRAGFEETRGGPSIHLLYC